MSSRTKSVPTNPPLIVIFGEESYSKSRRLSDTLDMLLPAGVDRTLALSSFDGTLTEEQGGPTLAAVMDDLLTLPFLAPRRIVLIRDADRFISACRERLERWVESPSPTGVLVLECRSFPKTTRLYKAAAAARCPVHECARLTARAIPDYCMQEASARGKTLDRAAAALLAERIGAEQGLLSGEIEKLALYVGPRTEIRVEDVRRLVGASREEKIFAVMDAAGAGEFTRAIRLWRQVMETDAAAAFRAVGGLAFVLRKWISAQEMHAGGASISAIAPKVMMWGREQELQTFLRRLDAERLRRLLGLLARLDAQAKSGMRSIENGVEALLFETARA